MTNNENGAIKVFIETRDSSSGVDANLVYNAPVPEGSSMIISDAGKTVLEAADELRVYCAVSYTHLTLPTICSV